MPLPASPSDPKCPEVKIDLEMEPLSTKLDGATSTTRDDAARPTLKPEVKVSGVINLLVREARAEAFEQWLQEIYDEVSQFTGFLYRDVARSAPRDGLIPISILIVFEREPSLRRWETSEERAAMLAKAHALELWDENRSQAMTTVGGTEPARWNGTSSSSPPQKPSAPPKWKLGLIIWACVSSCVTAWVAGGATLALIRLGGGGYIGAEVALLFNIFVIVVVVVYAFSELLIGLPLGPLSLAVWLKKPPTVFTVATSGGGFANFCRIVAGGTCSCLNVGCGCCNPPPPAPPPANILRRLARAEGRLEALRRTHHALLEGQMGAQELLDATSALVERDSRQQPGRDSSRVRVDSQAARSEVASKTNAIIEQVSSGDGSAATDEQGAISVGVHHHVRWECLEAYQIWLRLMHEAMQEAAGFVSMRTMAPDPSVDEFESESVHSVIFRFATLDTLQSWLYSKAREDLLVKLQPLLYASDRYTAARDRILPDAFTDALYPSNTEAPLRPPPKWKVCVITVASLWLVVYPVGLHLPPVLVRMGMTNLYGQIPITSAINVFLNTYAMNPLLMTLVGHWFAQPRPTFVDAQPWKFLDQGFGMGRGTLLLRLLVIVAYFLPLMVVWAVNDSGAPPAEQIEV